MVFTRPDQNNSHVCFEVRRARRHLSLGAEGYKDKVDFVIGILTGYHDKVVEDVAKFVVREGYAKADDADDLGQMIMGLGFPNAAGGAVIDAAARALKRASTLAGERWTLGGHL